ncbi:MAG: RHS repeat protein, partial [Proteobacteria bacterium]|nr:RHS repeat protein [Pseudomonadota bacterium]
MGKFSLLARDATGRVTSQTDANGKITLYQYDALGRLVKQT